MATSTCLAAPGHGTRAPGRAGTRRNVRTPSWHVRKVLGAKPYFGGSATRLLRHLAAACAVAAASKKAGAGAVCWCAAAALLVGFCGCGARAETGPPAAVGAIPSPQLPPFPPRCQSVPCCLRSLPLVRLTSLPPASAAARGQRRALGAAAVGTAAPLPVYHLRLQQVTTVVAAAACSQFF
eukprot:SAG25_NODE_1705_length_2512_cov_4.238293_2_plen_181_part_00